MKPRTDRKKLMDKLDALWSKRVLERDFYRCQLTKLPGTDPHHIFSRKNLSTRWDVDNGITLSREQHERMKTQAGKEDLRKFLNERSPGLYDRLQELSKVVVHYKNHDLLEIYEGLKRG